MRTIGIISDTNGVIDPQFARFFRNCDELWHCGDFDDRKGLIEILRLGKRLLAVRGDRDMDPVFERTFQQSHVFCVEGVRFLLIHKGMDNTLSAPALYPGIRDVVLETRPDCIICGHTEKYFDGTFTLSLSPEAKCRVRVLNPGALTPTGHSLQTALRMQVEGGRILSVDRMELYNGQIKIR